MNGNATPARTGAWVLWALLFVAVLCLQNGLMLGKLYFLGQNIPWDFAASYHAVPFFWIEAMKAGVSPDWVPFQGMGYPLYLNSQSGFHYPAYWWFVLTQQTYTYAAAIWFQGLHILFGAIGAGVCARLMGARWSSALLAAVAFQAFGAFYSNASHPDIVRAHALLPWVVAPVLARWQRDRLTDLCVWSLPLWVFCLWTGGYAGAAVAISFTSGLLLVARLVGSTPEERRVGCSVAAAFAIGMVAVGIFILPAALDRTEVVRGVTQVAAEYMNLRDVFALVLRIDTGSWFGHDVTMRSLSLGLPVVVLLVARPMLGQVRWAIWPLALAAFALAMSAGWAHKPLATLLSPLGYSRFTLSDYRGLLGLGLVLLAVQSFDLLPRTSLRQRVAGLAAASLITAAFTVAGTWLVYPGGRWIGTALACAIVALAAALALLAGRPEMSRRVFVAVTVALVALVGADWFRVHGGAGYLFSGPQSQAFQSVAGRSVDEAQRRLHALLEHPPGCRPARTAVAESQYLQSPWRGYYTGEYMTQDYSGPMKFVRHRQVLADSAAARFALQPWQAVSVPADDSLRSVEFAASPRSGLTCTSYGTTELRYAVDLDRPTRVVENELFWPGWVATIQGRVVAARSMAGFRAWDLPAGRYEMVARFEPPHRREGRLAFAAGLAAWVLLTIYLWRTKKWQ
jgi:hypothetical protein